MAEQRTVWGDWEPDPGVDRPPRRPKLTDDELEEQARAKLAALVPTSQAQRARAAAKVRERLRLAAARQEGFEL